MALLNLDSLNKINKQADANAVIENNELDSDSTNTNQESNVSISDNSDFSDSKENFQKEDAGQVKMSLSSLFGSDIGTPIDSKEKSVNISDSDLIAPVDTKLNDKISLNLNKQAEITKQELEETISTDDTSLSTGLEGNATISINENAKEPLYKLGKSSIKEEIVVTENLIIGGATQTSSPESESEEKEKSVSGSEKSLNPEIKEKKGFFSSLNFDDEMAISIGNEEEAPTKVSKSIFNNSINKKKDPEQEAQKIEKRNLEIQKRKEFFQKISSTILRFLKLIFSKLKSLTIKIGFFIVLIFKKIVIFTKKYYPAIKIFAINSTKNLTLALVKINNKARVSLEIKAKERTAIKAAKNIEKIKKELQQKEAKNQETLATNKEIIEEMPIEKEKIIQMEILFELNNEEEKSLEEETDEIINLNISDLATYEDYPATEKDIKDKIIEPILKEENTQEKSSQKEKIQEISTIQEPQQEIKKESIFGKIVSLFKGSTIKKELESKEEIIHLKLEQMFSEEKEEDAIVSQKIEEPITELITEKPKVSVGLPVEKDTLKNVEVSETMFSEQTKPEIISFGDNQNLSNLKISETEKELIVEKVIEEEPIILQEQIAEAPLIQEQSLKIEKTQKSQFIPIKEEKKYVITETEGAFGGFFSDMASLLFKGSVDKHLTNYKVKNVSLEDDIVYNLLGKEASLKIGENSYSLNFSLKGYEYIIPYFLYSVIALGDIRNDYKYTYNDAKEISEIHKNITKSLGFKNQNDYSIDASNIKSFVKGIKTLLDYSKSKYTILYDEESGDSFELVKK